MKRLQGLLVKGEGRTRDGRKFDDFYLIYSPDGQKTSTISVTLARAASGDVYRLFEGKKKDGTPKKGIPVSMVLSDKRSDDHNVCNCFVSTVKQKGSNKVYLNKEGLPVYKLCIYNAKGILNEDEGFVLPGHEDDAQGEAVDSDALFGDALDDDIPF